LKIAASTVDSPCLKELLFNPAYHNALIAACAMGVACALLSVLVVLRRWAFIGEGISHAGFGGVGTAWLLSLAFPFLASEAAAYGVGILFCLVMALIIGWVSRRDRLNADAAIGIVLVGSLAWGFVTLAIYSHRRLNAPAASGWDFYLLGQVQNISRSTMWAGVCVSAAVVLTLAVLAKEILFYCMDPDLAEVSGVRAVFVHYLLMLMLALMIVVSMRLAGFLLVTALLVLPGATALVVSQRLKIVLAVAVAVSLVGIVCGLALQANFPYLDSGPAMVLALVAQFAIAYGWTLLRNRARA
jgi:manganese/iron transport system permease protein